MPDDAANTPRRPPNPTGSNERKPCRYPDCECAMPCRERRRQFANTGLTAQVRRFINENPGEELSFEDAVAKFGCGPVAMRSALSNLSRMGEVEFVFRKAPTT